MIRPLLVAIALLAAPTIALAAPDVPDADAKKGSVKIAKAPKKKKGDKSSDKPADKPAAAPEGARADPRTAPSAGGDVGGGPAGAPAAGGALNLRGMSRIEFDDRLVQGQTNKANAIYLFERRESALRSLLKKRTDFHEEIDETLE